MASMSRSRHRFVVSLTVIALVITVGPLGDLAYAAQSHLRFYQFDHLGSTTLVTDEQGQVVQQTSYAPYGTQTTGGAAPTHGFTGQRRDESTGLLYYHARYYDPQLGRFISPDPLIQNLADPQALNRYAYVRNNPINLIDPTGHSFWSIFRRVYVALVTFGQSELIPLTTGAIIHLSERAGIDPRYPLAAYSAVVGAFTGGIGWGMGAAISGAATSFGTSLAMDTGTGRQITRKVAKEFFMDVVGMSPQAAYTAASIVVSTGVSIGISLGARGAQVAYKKVTTYDPSLAKGGPAIERTGLGRTPNGPNVIGKATTEMHPSGLLRQAWHQAVEEGGLMSNTANEVPGMNAFAKLHDEVMRNIGISSGLTRPLTVRVMNFPTMPPALAVTYGALAAPNSVAAGSATALSTSTSGYGASLNRWETYEAGD